MDRLASTFLDGGPDARFSAVDLRAAAGLHNARLYPLLEEMQRHGWITHEVNSSDLYRRHCYLLTERGRAELSND